MGLRQQAAADLQAILEDAAGGFGWPVTVTDPSGLTAALTGLTTDVGYFIDPDTGQAVIGRKASVALRISALTTAGMGMPRGIADETAKPWVIAFADINGTVFTWKVTQAFPDRTLGVVVLILESYET